MSLQFWFNTGLTKLEFVQMKSWQGQYQPPTPSFTLAQHWRAVSLPAFGIQALQPPEGMLKSPRAQEGKLRDSKRKTSTFI